MAVRKREISDAASENVSGGKISYNAANDTWTSFNDKTGLPIALNQSLKDAVDYDACVNNPGDNNRVMSETDKLVYKAKANDYLRGQGIRGLNRSWLNQYYE